MNDLSKRSMRVLEFDKILDLLSNKISSDLAKEYAKEIKISKDINIINTRLKETSEALSLIIKKSDPPLFGIYPMKDYMKRASIGGSLSAGAILKVGDFLRVSRYLKKYFETEDRENYPILRNFFDSLFSYKTLEDEISEAIISEEEIADGASPRLASIRRQITKKKDSLRDRLNQLVTNEEYKKYLQDSIVTIREGRYVVPVKQENKSKIKGLVHDVSGSGATVYVEPMAVVNLNNELKTLYAEEKEEIERILKELTEKIAGVGYEISANEEVLKEIDFIFAKAKLSIEMNATKPILNEKGYINLKRARHPLLKVKNVVPIDIYLGDEFTSLIITGPNTGGKTVSIKTIGLLTLMAQYGLHIPAAESSEIAVFNEVLADIGDEQSIEQSLSTFSSHLVNIVEILKVATNKSLVIFDELGAGTDPTEGAALARAIMDYMLEKEIRTIATTHYNQLKIYALTVDRVANASMEFNVDTLSPTYRLLIGVPGKSNAFEISKRLGLSNEIIDYARNLINNDNIEFEEVLASIEEDRTRIQESRIKSEVERRELEDRNEKLKKELERVRLSRDKVIEEAKAEGRRMVKRAKIDMELVLDEINSIRSELSREQARRLQDAQDILRKADSDFSKIGSEIVIEKVTNHIKKIKIGDRVKSNSLNAEATVLELPDKDGNVLVQIGMMKMKLPKNTLSYSNRDEEIGKSKAKRMIERKSKYIKSEIDLRGKNFEEAKIETEKYIDDAYLSGLKSVRIIHGKGTGVLREKLRQYLKNNKSVKDIEDAAYNEGGSGVTIVKLK